MIHYKNIVIGAGIAGLTVASKLDDCLILEKTDRAGGLCKSFYENGFIWDCSGHFFHFTDENIKNEFCSLVGKENILEIEKNINIFYKDRYIDYPFQDNIFQLPEDEYKECLLKTDVEYDGLLGKFYKNYGEGVVNKFLRPYNEKLYCCDLTSISENQVGRFMPPKNKTKTYNHSFLYPKNGSQMLIDALENKCAILYNIYITSIDLKNKIISTTNGKFSYDNLINTAPLKTLLRLTNSNQELYRKLRANKTLVLNLGFDKEDTKKTPQWTYVPNKDINFYRLGYYNRINNTKKLSMYVEIGFSETDIVDINNQLKLTIDNLIKMNIISSEDKLTNYNSIIIEPAYVYIDNTQEEIVQTIKELQKNNIYTIGRYGSWAYFSIEDSIKSANEIIEKVK